MRLVENQICHEQVRCEKESSIIIAAVLASPCPEVSAVRFVALFFLFSDDIDAGGGRGLGGEPHSLYLLR